MAGHVGREPSDPTLQDMTVDELMTSLHASQEGLSQSEAQGRLEQYGYNELVEKKESPILIFLSYLWGPIPWMIEIAAGISAAVEQWADFAIIGTLLVINACVGFWEEYQAGNTIEALKARLALSARALRDGKWKSIPARQLVPGDIIRLRLGEIVPADAKLAGADPLQVDQSALTGESLPVDKGTGEAVYSGSIIRQGETEALVYATGRSTYMGKTAQLVEEARTVSHFQQAVLKIGDYLIVIAIMLAVLIIIVALFRGTDIVTTLLFVLVLTVAAVPVAMPTVLTVTLAVGARLIARQEAIVSRLASIEELAGVDVLCSDKTGTLTQNKLTLGKPYTVSGISSDEVITAAALASREEDQDPIDLAILQGLRSSDQLQDYTISEFVPFDPVHKRTEATVKGPDGVEFAVSKGAPQVIMNLAEDRDKVRDDVDKAIQEFASRGYRSLGVAKADEQGHWRFLGVLPLFDPPREDSKSTLETARNMGINTKMITGDQVAIAKEISSQLGLGTNILDAKIFDESGVDDHTISDKIEQSDGFAQVFPEHKFRIVESLQGRGHIVGMTGDGVNDAPPLKKADAGIAVEGATDAARSAADIVLLRQGLSVIIDAIKESRKIFQRMNNYAIYRITETIRVLLFMTLSILVFDFYPVTAIMIVLLAILNDGAILSIAYDRVHYSDKPVSWNMRAVLELATILGITGVVESFGLFYLAEQVFGMSRDIIQSLIYLKLSVAGHLTVFVVRTRGPFWSIKPAKILLWAVIGTQALATLIVVFGIFMTPIGWRLAGLVWAYTIMWFFIEDRVKLATYHLLDPEKSTLSSCRRCRG